MNCSQWRASPSMGTAMYRELLQTLSLVLWPSGPAASPPDLNLHMIFTTYSDSWDPKATMLTRLTQPAPLSFASLSLLQHVLLEQSCSEMDRHHCHSQGEGGWWLPTGSHRDTALQRSCRKYPPCVKAPSPAAFEFGCWLPTRVLLWDNDYFFTYLRKWSCVADKVQRESRRCNKTANFNHQQLKD